MALVLDLGHRRLRRWKEEGIKNALLLCALVSVLTTIGIIATLFSEAVPFFAEVSPVEFLTGDRWAPLLEPRSFGVRPLITGTILVAAGAALIAIPLGVGSAIFLSEYAPGRVRSILKPVLEVLAGVPTVVYGYFALTTITPALQAVFPSTQVFNAASASVVVGIMILPMIASLCEDAFHAVPRSLREAGYALGATKMEVSTRVVVPGALSGVLASFVLAVSRAIGETMAVTLAAGAVANGSLNPFEAHMTMTAYIVNVSLGDTPHGTIGYQTIFAVGLLLFFLTLGMNLLANRIMKKYREVYD